MGFDPVIEGEGLLEDSLAGIGQGWNRFEEFPCALVVIAREHSAAAERVAILRIATSIQTTAQDGQGLINRNVRARNAAITNRKGGRRHGPYAASDHVRFAISIGHRHLLNPSQTLSMGAFNIRMQPTHPRRWAI